jgi:CheY-like chemotaxis protein
MSEKSRTADRARRILVAEDDHEMRRVLVDAFVQAGHDVLAVADGASLLHELAHSPRHNFDAVDLIVSDVRMPRCSGLEAMEAIRAIRPGVKIVLITAFPDEDIRALARRIDLTVLEKPFSLDRLQEVTGTLLSSR